MFFDARLHPAGLTDQDLETLRFFGVEAALVPCDATPLATVKNIRAHFDDVLNTQLPRLERAGIRGYAAFGVHPLSLPRRGLSELMQALPTYLGAASAAAVGTIGLSKNTDAERDAFTEQLLLARRFQLPAVVGTPVTAREAVTRKTLTLLKTAGLAPSAVMIQGATGSTLRLIRELGHWAALTLHPDALTVEQAVKLVRASGVERLVLETAAGDGASDILAISRAASLLDAAGLTAAVVARVTGRNAALFFKGRSSLD